MPLFSFPMVSPHKIRPLNHCSQTMSRSHQLFIIRLLSLGGLAPKVRLFAMYCYALPTVSLAHPVMQILYFWQVRLVQGLCKRACYQKNKNTFTKNIAFA